MRRLLLAVAVVTALLVAGGVAVFWTTSGKGASSIEQWIGRQIVGLAQGYLEPTLTFDELDYEAPFTVSLRGMKLTAADPANAGQTIDVLVVPEARLTLAEVPAVGKPIVIKEIALTRPTLRAVAMRDLADPTSPAGFVGLSNLLKREPLEAIEAKLSTTPSSPPDAPTGQVASGDQPASDRASAPGGAARLSDYFRLNQIRLDDATVVYDPRLPGETPLTLDRISTVLDIHPEQDDAVTWHSLKLDLARAPVFELAVAGQVSLDNFTARKLDASLKATLSRENDEHLLPELRAILRQYDLSGDLAVHLTGEVALTDPLSANLSTRVNITGGRATLTPYRVQMESLELTALMAGRQIALESIAIEALRGRATARGALRLEDMTADLSATVEGMHLEDTQVADTGQSLGYAGVLDAHVSLSATPVTAVAAHLAQGMQPPHAGETPASGDALAAGDGSGAGDPQGRGGSGLGAPHSGAAASLPALPQQWGQGWVKLERARLVQIPVLSDLSGMLSKGMSALGGGSDGLDESVSADFRMTGERMTLDAFTYTSPAVAARGTGTVGLDKTLDLKVNAGPLEKVQGMLGGVGSAIGRVTDAVSGYRVTGTIDQPTIELEVGGATTGQIGHAVGDAAGRARNMAGKATDVASDMAGKATDVASDMAGKASDVAGDVAGKATDAASDVAGKGSSAVKKLGRGIRGVFGGNDEKDEPPEK